ncbi:hypothetical protein RHGRI_029366 [Rhododendron griersonianum]|uniref:Uncharacterized protein n=1 Tax=Rhododendron griersonianum TaxID=479676 RepID=A0AAV6IJ62_9ERIC|nr:hypothetical protein RHGRI_029366 [Rhododendron griersonianum]
MTSSNKLMTLLMPKRTPQQDLMMLIPNNHLFEKQPMNLSTWRRVQLEVVRPLKSTQRFQVKLLQKSRIWTER